MLPPPPPAHATLTLTVVISATVETFDQSAYINGLAGLLGVAPSAITLTITSGSLIVAASVSAPTAASSDVMLATMQAINESTLATATGATVTAVQAVVRTLILSPPPPSAPPPTSPTYDSPPPPVEEEDGFPLAVILIGGGAALLALVAVSLLGCWRNLALQAQVRTVEEDRRGGGSRKDPFPVHSSAMATVSSL